MSRNTLPAVVKRDLIKSVIDQDPRASWRRKGRGRSGRPHEFERLGGEDEVLRQLEDMARKGYTWAQICSTWDISRQTFYRWCKQNQRFGDAVQRAREHRTAADEWKLEQLIATGGKAAAVQLNAMRLRHRHDYGEQQEAATVPEIEVVSFQPAEAVDASFAESRKSPA